MSPVRMSKLETAIRVVMEYHEAFNRHDIAGMMKLMSDDCIYENSAPAPNGAICKGKEAITQYWQDFFHESPQARLEIEEIFSMGLGHRCIMRWKCDWGNGHVRGVDIFKERDGLICEKLSYVKG